jgi:ubiquitin C-terminal hydrolase
VRELDMSPHVVRRPHSEGVGSQMVYELNGVLNHYGNMQGGHYTGVYQVIEVKFSVSEMTSYIYIIQCL